MNIEKFREYCLSKAEVEEAFPFDESTLVFKVCNKIFALTDINDFPFHVNLKCKPEYAIELREQWEQVKPGYHMNKKHWNTIAPDNAFPDKLLLELTDHSYLEVVKTLKKIDKDRILKIYNK
jgi:predicted DNA-binding protein (MmcQ/YjbR family)